MYIAVEQPTGDKEMFEVRGFSLHPLPEDRRLLVLKISHTDGLEFELDVGTDIYVMNDSGETISSYKI